MGSETDMNPSNGEQVVPTGPSANATGNDKENDPSLFSNSQENHIRRGPGLQLQPLNTADVNVLRNRTRRVSIMQGMLRPRVFRQKQEQLDQVVPVMNQTEKK